MELVESEGAVALQINPEGRRELPDARFGEHVEVTIGQLMDDGLDRRGLGLERGRRRIWIQGWRGLLIAEAHPRFVHEAVHGAGAAVRASGAVVLRGAPRSHPVDGRCAVGLGSCGGDAFGQDDKVVRQRRHRLARPQRHHALELAVEARVARRGGGGGLVGLSAGPGLVGLGPGGPSQRVLPALRSRLLLHISSECACTAPRKAWAARTARSVSTPSLSWVVWVG